jgi:Domain of unknown function (DUF3479)
VTAGECWLASRREQEVCPELQLTVLTDRDIAEDRGRVEAVLAEADAFFGSLIFDYDQVTYSCFYILLTEVLILCIHVCF